MSMHDAVMVVVHGGGGSGVCVCGGGFSVTNN